MSGLKNVSSRVLNMKFMRQATKKTEKQEEKEESAKDAKKRTEEQWTVDSNIKTHIETMANKNVVQMSYGKINEFYDSSDNDSGDGSDSNSDSEEPKVVGRRVFGKKAEPEQENEHGEAQEQGEDEDGVLGTMFGSMREMRNAESAKEKKNGVKSGNKEDIFGDIKDKGQNAKKRQAEQGKPNKKRKKNKASQTKPST